MKVIFVASEVAPIAKVGGLGDVVGSLPKALETLGVDVRIVTGYYGTHNEALYPTREIAKCTVPWGSDQLECAVRLTTLPGSTVPVYLVHYPQIVGNGSVYTSPTAQASGQAESERFLLISKVAVALPKIISWQPDIWHLHDWHAAAVTLFLTEPHAPILLTIHNLANQGWAAAETLRHAGLPAVGAEHANLFRLGLERATWLSTVSPSYAAEIQTPSQGEGLDEVLKARASELTGITNGIDTEEFNPATDKLLAERYTTATVTKGKLANRKSLAAMLGLADTEVPLCGIVSRLTNQKGIELMAEALEPYLGSQKFQFVFLGVGDPVLEQKLNGLVARHSGWAAGTAEFNELLARRIYAAADFFLMPSRFEPCGLGQLIAMRYGTVPIVRATGGLRDTVTDIAQAGGTGIVFDDYSAVALERALARALELARDSATLRSVVLAAMTYESSWRQSAQQYLSLYTSICAPK